MRRALQKTLKGEKIEILFELYLQGKEIVLVVSGGEAHIGSVVLASSHASRTGVGQSATSSVLNLFTHKDEFIVRQLAEKLAKLSGKHVVAIGGVHFETFNDEIFEDVARVNQAALEAANSWLEEIDI